MNKLLVSLDGLHVHDLATMDMDEFKEWLWPGVKLTMWSVPVFNGKVWPCHAFPILDDLKSERVIDRGTWFEVHVYARLWSKAEHKAMAMVNDHLNTCFLS